MKTPAMVYFGVFSTMTATFQLISLETEGQLNWLLSAAFSMICVLFFAAVDRGWFSK